MARLTSEVIAAVSAPASCSVRIRRYNGDIARR